MLELKLSKSYLSALFEEAKHGRTFSTEANAMIREISEPGVFLSEFFGDIDKAPGTRFEAHLKNRAHQINNTPKV